MSTENKGYIDVFKFIFSILIIMLHTHFLYSTGTGYHYFSLGLLRLAVPFFFVCSGYFFARKIYNKQSEIKIITKEYIKRLAIPLVFWLIVGLITSEFVNNYNGNILETIVFFIKKIVFYPWGALWYIFALIVSIFILSKFYQKNKYVEPVLVGFFLYLFALICNSYYFVISNSGYIKMIVDSYLDFCFTARNGLFVGLLFVSLGGLLYKLREEKKIFNTRSNIFYFVCCYMILLFEITIIRKNITADDSSLFFILPFLSFFLVSILTRKSTKKNYLILRKLSISLYLLHRPMLGIFNTYLKIDYGNKLFILVFSSTLIISLIVIKINNKYINKLFMI